jgi:hypothetical protein
MKHQTAERKYRSLVRTVAENGINLTMANQLTDLYQLLSIESNWFFDDVQRARRGEKMKSLPVVQ